MQEMNLIMLKETVIGKEQEKLSYQIIPNLETKIIENEIEC